MNAVLRGGIRRAAAVLLAIGMATGVGHAAPEACAIDQGLQPAGKALPHLADVLTGGKRLDILAVGSATMLGPRMGVAGSFPARTVQKLHEARPHSDIRLVTHAERGASAVELLGVLRREIAAHPASLVLWQIGTAEVARGQPPAEFEHTLQEGVRLALSAGSDIVLIDLPFSRLLTSRADPDPYNGAFVAAATPPGAAVFSRFSLTRTWVNTGALDLERAPPGQRHATLARLHECLAEALSRALLAASRLPPDSTVAR